jgi:hypothetical protein
MTAIDGGFDGYDSIGEQITRQTFSVPRRNSLSRGQGTSSHQALLETDKGEKKVETEERRCHGGAFVRFLSPPANFRFLQLRTSCPFKDSPRLPRTTHRGIAPLIPFYTLLSFNSLPSPSQWYALHLVDRS